MKSSYALAALVGFALLNTVLLGAYLVSPGGVTGELNSGPVLYGTSTSTVPATTSTTTAASTATATVASASSLSTTTTVATTSTNSSSGYEAYGGSVSTLKTSSGISASSVLQFFEVHSLALAPGSWVAVGGMWIWRGRMRSRWRDFGFDSDVFGLFVKMKGGKTRIRLLDALSLPKDRLQLAQELGLDWKGVDRHLVLLKKYGFVDDRVAYGKVRMYQLTPMGSSLLKLLQDLSREERREAGPPGQPLQSGGIQS